MSTMTRPASLLAAAALLAAGLAGCQTQSGPRPSSAGYDAVENWPSSQSRRSNSGGD